MKYKQYTKKYKHSYLHCISLIIPLDNDNKKWMVSQLTKSCFYYNPDQKLNGILQFVSYFPYNTVAFFLTNSSTLSWRRMQI